MVNFLYLFSRSELFDLKTPQGRAFFDFLRAEPAKNQKTLAPSPSFAAEGGERGGC